MKTFSYAFVVLAFVFSAYTSTQKSVQLFDGKTFKANLPIEAVYKFNSYRFTYNRIIVSKDKFKFGLGLSAKIRDAGFSLKNKEFERGNFSLGFVPLINLLANWELSQKMGIDFFGEGLAASKGRAIDLSLSGRYNLTKNLTKIQILGRYASKKMQIVDKFLGGSKGLNFKGGRQYLTT